MAILTSLLFLFIEKIMKKNRRIFVPGSEWLYLKIYAGSTTADQLLVQNIYNVINIIVKNKICIKWFFIRYQDPDFHLRLRFLLNNPLDMGYVLNLFQQRLSAFIINGQIWRLQVDTYNRELERYKTHLIDITETLFYIDSIFTIKLLRLLGGFSDAENLRWGFSIKMIDMFLDDFTLGLEEKQKLLEQMDNSFKAEFGYDQFNAKQLNLLYRQYTPLIQKVMDKDEEEFKVIYSVLKQKSKQMKPVMERIRQLDRKNELNDLLFSYIHMMMNRWFRSKNRLCELLIYNFLNRYYISIIARNEKK